MSITLAVGSIGNDVRRLQEYLNDELTASLNADGIFGGSTKAEVVRFRRRFGLPEAASFDAQCFAVSSTRGFAPPAFDPDPRKADLLKWPPRPRGLSSPSASVMQAKCGTITFTHRPEPGNAEHIDITNTFVTNNIVSVTVPQLSGCIIPTQNSAFKSDGRIRFHKNYTNKLLSLFADWERAGLMDRVLTYDGSFNARLKRGSTRASVANLSNHSWGTAFDINAAWNPRKVISAAMGDRGCLRELVALAHTHGFYWGGHFSVPDGMHFEIAAETL